MRRLIKLLSPVFFAALLLSCLQSVKQDGSITFDTAEIISSAVQYSNNKSRSAAGDDDSKDYSPEMLAAMNEALEFRATLSMQIASADNSYQDSFEETYIADIAGETVLGNKNISFNNVPVGIKANLKATITAKLVVKNEAALKKLFESWGMDAESLSDWTTDDYLEMLDSTLNWNFILDGSAEVTVHAGDNPVSINMTYTSEKDEGIGVSGAIEVDIPQTLTISINQAKSDSSFYLNHGQLVFKLLDEDGNDLAAAPENASTAGAIWTYKLTLRNTLIPAEIDSVTCYTYSPGKIAFTNLPAGGNYQLYVQAQPIATGYGNCSTTSAVFDIEVGPTLVSFNAENLLTESTVSEAFQNLLNSTSSDTTIKISGEISESCDDALQAIFTATNSLNYKIGLDLSDMTTSSSAIRMGHSSNVNDWDNLLSIVLPEDVTEIKNEYFSGCTNLKSVTFGSRIKMISSGSVFSGCSKLSSVTIPESAPLWLMCQSTFAGCTSLRTLKLPSSFVLLGKGALPSNLDELILTDESGSWYYVDNDNDFNVLVNENGSFASSATDKTLESLCSAVPGYTLSQKLLYAAKNNSNYAFYCIK